MYVTIHIILYSWKYGEGEDKDSKDEQEKREEEDEVKVDKCLEEMWMRERERGAGERVSIPPYTPIDPHIPNILLYTSKYLHIPQNLQYPILRNPKMTISRVIGRFQK